MSYKLGIFIYPVSETGYIFIPTLEPTQPRRRSLTHASVSNDGRTKGPGAAASAGPSHPDAQGTAGAHHAVLHQHRHIHHKISAGIDGNTRPNKNGKRVLGVRWTHIDPGFHGRMHKAIRQNLCTEDRRNRNPQARIRQKRKNHTLSGTESGQQQLKKARHKGGKHHRWETPDYSNYSISSRWRTLRLPPERTTLFAAALICSRLAVRRTAACAR